MSRVIFLSKSSARKEQTIWLRYRKFKPVDNLYMIIFLQMLSESVAVAAT